MHTFVPPAFACMFIVYTLLNNAPRRVLYVSERERAMKPRKKRAASIMLGAHFEKIRSLRVKKNSRLLRGEKRTPMRCEIYYLKRDYQKRLTGLANFWVKVV